MCIRDRRERDDINQEIDSLEQEIELLKNKCEYYINTASVNRKILYSLKIERNMKI